MFNGKITEENNLAVTKMLFESVHEMALAQSNTIEHPVSLSLHLLEMGVDDETIEDQLIKKAVDMVFSAKDPMELTTEDFQKEFEKNSPLIANASSVKYILRWIGMYAVPKIYPVAVNLV